MSDLWHYIAVPLAARAVSHILAQVAGNMLLKAAKYEIQKPPTCSAKLFGCKFGLMFHFFSPCEINLLCKKICCELKKFVAQSRARVYFEQQLLALLLVFHQTLNLSHSEFAEVVGFCISDFTAFSQRVMQILMFSLCLFFAVIKLHNKVICICPLPCPS